MDASLFLPFALATLTFAVMPGPGVLYCVARSVAHGTRAGLMASLGIHIGGYAHVIAAGLGLAIVFEAVPVLFAAMKIAGAAYLLWIGVGLLRAGWHRTAMALPKAERSSFRQSVLVEVLNPKTALFYVAFLPQFVSPEASLSLPTQLILLGIVVNVAFSASDVAYAVAAGALRRRLAASAGAVAWAQKAGGALLMGLGLNLLVTRTSS
ncbi:MAG: LysE family translocator [Pseudomonadota bacterium]